MIDIKRLHDLRILLVEDNEADVKIAKRAFRDAGYTHNLDIVRTGADALDYLVGRGEYINRNLYPKPHIVLLDLNMPGMNGFEVLGAIKKEPVIHDIPVIIVTTSLHTEDIRRAYRMGVASYVVKSPDFSEFVTTIKGLLDYWNSVSVLPGRGGVDGFYSHSG